MLLLVKLQAKVTKSNPPPCVFLRFLNCPNDTKSRNASHILELCNALVQVRFVNSKPVLNIYHKNTVLQLYHELPNNLS